MAARKARNIFRRLIGKVLSGKATKEEDAFAEAYYRHFDKEEGYLEQLPVADKEALGNQLLQRIQAGIETPGTTGLRTRLYPIGLWKAGAAAAVLLGVLLIVFYPKLHKQQVAVATKRPAITTAEALTPGTNKAILTLSDGKTIVLDSARSSLLVRQGAVQITQQTPGSLAYQANSAGSGEIQMNMIQTPRGGQFLVVLSDGTRVWLNAASWLKYPVSFTGGDRMVELNGEAYFEVAHRSDQPFKVKMQEQVVEVLGTHFNVMAYDDEPVVQTTLLEGKVKVHTDAQERILSPGQQAVVNKFGRKKVVVRPVNTDHFVAWKNGSFSFDNTDIYTMMRQISRWYDVEIHYKDSLDLYFNGSLKKDVNAATLFKMLALTGEVKYSIANGILTIEKR